ncbi:MAG: FKBP-type peptidyl-prolyl cis-trans isomerase [Deltaproteobacteria bacterium]|nr:FKBP-type peptidyl-prolyl cis-trans isomerase [Deltaproteobacteria bacterium]
MSAADGERRYGGAAELEPAPGAPRGRGGRGWLIGAAALLGGAGLLLVGWFAVLAPKADAPVEARRAKDTPVTVVVPPPDAGWLATPSGLMIVSEEVGSGAPCLPQHECVMHYKGWLWDHGRGALFDESTQRGPFKAKPEHLIPGFAEAIKRLRVGGKIAVVIPPALGYGDRKMKVIPAQSSLLFEIELVDAR